MIPFERFIFKSNRAKADKYDQSNYFLNHFQLNQIKRSAVVPEAHPVRGHLGAIFT